MPTVCLAPETVGFEPQIQDEKEQRIFSNRYCLRKCKFDVSVLDSSDLIH